MVIRNMVIFLGSVRNMVIYQIVIFLKVRDKPLGTRVKIVLHLRRVKNIEENCKVANYLPEFIHKSHSTLFTGC